MSDAVHIEQGASPWIPTPETTPGVVLHRYDIPLVGVILQHGVTYLFWCVTGHAAPENAWAYANVDDEAVARLEAAEGDSFDGVLREVVENRVCTFAVASDDRGLMGSVVLTPPASFDDVYQRGMAEMGERFREMIKEYELLLERFPSMESAARFGLAPSRQIARAAG